MALRREENLNPQEVRERVDRVMDAWQTFPDFAHFFDALLRANGISEEQFAQEYARTAGRRVSSALVDLIKRGLCQPSYEFVTNIADHALLSLDAGRLQPATGSTPAGDHRLALFNASGLIEVTPESISQWNQEVLAGWRRRRERSPQRPQPRWGELMSRLLSFHSQGGRRTHKDFADAANAASPSLALTEGRLFRLLSGRTIPSQDERCALATVAGLDTQQISLVEAAVENGSLSLTRPLSPSAFSRQLTDLLERLNASGISQSELRRRTVPPGESEPELESACLSNWKLGRNKPTQAYLRIVVRALERCHDHAGRRLVAPEEIHRLVAAAGFAEFDMTATTHDIVARIDGATRLKPLLSALRNAIDINATRRVIKDIPAEGDLSEKQSLRASQLEAWENDALAASATPSQVRDLLNRYNQLLHEKGCEELRAAEIEKVMDVAQRDREDGMKRGFQRRAHQHSPRLPRHKIRPDFDDGPGR